MQCGKFFSQQNLMYFCLYGVKTDSNALYVEKKVEIERPVFHLLFRFPKVFCAGVRTPFNDAFTP